jgi:hypothetical protein
MLRSTNHFETSGDKETVELPTQEKASSVTKSRYLTRWHLLQNEVSSTPRCASSSQSARTGKQIYFVKLRIKLMTLHSTLFEGNCDEKHFVHENWRNLRENFVVQQEPL